MNLELPDNESLNSRDDSRLDFSERADDQNPTPIKNDPR